MAYTYDHPHPAVTTDIVVFTILRDELAVLLVKRSQPPFKGGWALPGGFVNPDESLDAGARRELCEETGISGVRLEQFYTFGEPDRDPRERVITVAYLALVPHDRIELSAASDAADVAWFGHRKLPELAFDHDRIIAMAHERLVARLAESAISVRLMPQTFTLSELQHVHEVILGEAIDEREFRRRILGLGVLEEAGEKQGQRGRRPARLYRVDDPERVETCR